LRKILGDPLIGVYIDSLPKGCVKCYEGSKVVVFATGLCHDNCFYCPLSEQRRRDVFFVDEEKASSKEALNAVIQEIWRIDAKGASFTGGDPLLKPSLTIKLLKNLKKEFGSSFHTHLYTSGRYATRELLEELYSAGLDEIRFHPVRDEYLKSVENAIKYTNMSVGIEVPALPHSFEWLKKLALFLEEHKGDFLNINELEVTETNVSALVERGYEPLQHPPVVKGSRETALSFLKWAAKNLRRVRVHFITCLQITANQWTSIILQ